MIKFGKIIIPLFFVLSALTIFYWGCTSSTAPDQITTPVISSVSPERGPVGIRATLSGRHFTDDKGKVLFRDTEADILSWKDTSIAFVVPSDAIPGDIQVKVYDTSSNSIYFLVENRYIDSIVPGSAVPGMEVTIYGSNLGSVQGIVAFDTLEAEIISWSNSKVVVIVPEGATSCNIELRAQGLFSNIIGFGVEDIFIARIEPSRGIPGSQVTIYGRYFGETPSRVTIENKNMEIINWSDTLITAKIPVDAITGDIYVHRGSKQSNGLQFNIEGVYITSVVPDFAPIGSEVEIHGSFYGAEEVNLFFGDIQAEILEWSNTLIRAIVPENTQSGNIYVQAHGMISNGLNFDVMLFSITSIEPENAIPGQKVEIYGYLFGQSQGTVLFNSIEAEIINWSDTLIVTRIPEEATSGNVIVQRYGENSNSYYYEISQNPTLLQRLLLTNSVEVTFRGFGISQSCERDWYGRTTCDTSSGGYMSITAKSEDWYNQYISWEDSSFSLDFELESFGYNEFWVVDLHINGFLSSSGDEIIRIYSSFSISSGTAHHSSNRGAGVNLKNIPFSQIGDLEDGIIFHAEGFEAADIYISAGYYWGSNDMDSEDRNGGTILIDPLKEGYPPEFTVRFWQK
jgi:IPT/TIG domain